MIYCFVLLLVPAIQGRCEDRVAWMKDAKFGVMNHYLSDWMARTHNLTMNVEKWNSLVDGFDVERLAAQLESVGAAYYVITIGQNSGYYLTPNATYDRYTGITPSKCSRRDLVAALSSALSKRGIKLVAYLPSGAPAGDRRAREALEWQNGPFRNAEFQLKWEAVIREWAERWKDKVAGWWFDGCYWPNAMYRGDPPNYATFALAARAGNPMAVIAFNPGVVPRLISVTPYEDYTAGEIDDLTKLTIRRETEGKVDGRQIHVLSFMGRTWGMGEPRMSGAEAAKWTQMVLSQQGAMTWDVPVGLDGAIAEPYLGRLREAARAAGRLRP
jgi:alpha-L-fucosidase-like protein